MEHGYDAHVEAWRWDKNFTKKFQRLIDRALIARRKSTARYIISTGMMPVGFSALESLDRDKRFAGVVHIIEHERAKADAGHWQHKPARLEAALGILLFCRWGRRFPQKTKVGAVA